MDKRITYRRETRDYDADLDGQYIGSFASFYDAEVALDQAAYDLLASQAAFAPATASAAGPGVESVVLVAAELAQVADEAGDLRGRNAFNKAAYYATAGVRPVVTPRGALVPSATAGGVVYFVDIDRGCGCEAAQHGKACWHAALVESLTIATARMADPLPEEAAA